MFPPQLKFLPLVLVIAFACLAQNAQQSEVREKTIEGFETRGGVVNFVEGDVRVRTAHSNTSRITSHNQLDTGDQVVTTAGSRAEIVLSPAYYLRLDENTTCLILDLKPDNQKLTLTRGSAIVEILQNNAGSFG